MFFEKYSQTATKGTRFARRGLKSWCRSCDTTRAWPPERVGPHPKCAYQACLCYRFANRDHAQELILRCFTKTPERAARLSESFSSAPVSRQSVREVVHPWAGTIACWPYEPPTGLRARLKRDFRNPGSCFGNKMRGIGHQIGATPERS